MYGEIVADLQDQRSMPLPRLQLVDLEDPARRHGRPFPCPRHLSYCTKCGSFREIAYGEGSVWATLFGFPITKIDPATNKVTQQWTGKGGDSIGAGLGSVWLTDLRAGVIWRLDPALQ